MENNTKIITKKASRVRFTVSNALGGIGWAELFIVFAAVVLITLSLTLLAKLSLLAGIITPVIVGILTIFFIAPSKNGDKLYYVIFIALGFLFKQKNITSKTRATFKLSITVLFLTKNKHLYIK